MRYRSKTDPKKSQAFDRYYESLPVSKRDTSEYNLRRAFDLAPQEELSEFANNPDAHLRTFYFNEEGVGEFMKSPNHPTVNKELDFYYSDEGADFRSKYDLVQGKDGYKYVPKRTELMDMPRGRVKPYRATMFDKYSIFRNE